MKLGLNIFAFVSSTIALLCPVRGDTLEFKDGQTVSGKITGETDLSVSIATPNGRFTFPRTKILRLQKESVEANQIRELRELIRIGNLDAAMILYRNKKLSDNISPATFNAILLSELATTAGGLNATSPTATLIANNVTDAVKPPFEVVLLAASLSLTSGNQNQAITLLKKISFDNTTKLSWPEQSISLLINHIADNAIKQKNGQILARISTLSARLPTPRNSTSTEYLAVYAQITDQIKNSNYLHATVLFTPELFLHRADLFIPLAESLITTILAAQASSSSLAALQSARVTILPFINEKYQIQALKALVNRLTASGMTDEAQDIADETASKDPDIGAILQHLVEFRMKESALPKDDPIAKYKLAAWARSMGLLDESVALFKVLRSDPRFAETADLQLKLIEQTQAKNTIHRLKTLYGKHELEQLQKETSNFLNSSPPEEFAQQARDLLQLIDFENWNAGRRSLDKAEAEFQQAERLSNRREFNEALMHLNRIQIDEGNSAAAAKAEKLRDQIMQELRKQEYLKERNAPSPPPSEL